MNASRPLLYVLACAGAVCLLGDQQPFLRTSVHAVEVTVVATRSGGAIASDLGATEFRVWDNGKEQSIATFERVTSRAGSDNQQLPPNTFSNRFGKAGRPQVLSIILLDGLNTEWGDQAFAQRAVTRIIERLQADERVAIFFLGNGLRMLHDFSSDTASLLSELKKNRGAVPDLIAARGEMPKFVREKLMAQKTLITFQALEALSNYVQGVPGRKNLLWLSAGFPMVILGESGDFGDLGDIRAFGKEMRRTSLALNAANVAVYTIDARGLSVDPRAFINIGVMQEIAGATGGQAFYNTNDLEGSVRAALDDTREVYVLSYYPAPFAEDGSYHRIRVQSARGGVQLRYRRGYYAPEAGAGSVSAPDRLASALSSPLDVSEIGITASVEQGTGGADDLVVVRVDPADLGLARSADRWTGTLRLVVIQTGAAGQRYPGVQHTAELALASETYQRALETGLRFEVKVKHEKRAAALRVGVVEERSGRAGSLTVPLPAVPSARPAGR